jgi:SAM-dependent methyltransferase
MSGTRALAPTSAPIQGPLWSARATDWADVAAGISVPAWQAVAGATGIGHGTQVLDLGCGSGEFGGLAAARGASVSGIDAAEGMIAIARREVPHGDFRVGAMENLPWEDDRFDVLTAFTALQFAADLDAALAEAARVTRPGGQVAICDWSRQTGSELHSVLGALHGLMPPPPPGAAPGGPELLSQPGALESMLRRAGLEPARDEEVAVPFAAPDQPTLLRALLCAGPMVPLIEHAGEDAVRRTIVAASEPFRRSDGSYRFDNTFRYVIAIAPGAGG